MWESSLQYKNKSLCGLWLREKQQDQRLFLENSYCDEKEEKKVAITKFKIKNEIY